MIKEIIMPKLGQTVEEATVEKWHKKEGDKVEKGEVLLEVVTDKATLEVESFHKGFLRKILVKEGETVPVLQVIGYVADSMEEKLPEVPKSVSEVEEKESFEPQIPQVKSEEEKPIEEKVILPRIKASPLAKKLAQELNIDLSKIKGTGPGGRITKEDVLGAQKEKGEKIKEIPLSSMRKSIIESMTKSKREIPHFYLTTEVDMTECIKLRSQLIEEFEKKGFPKPAFDDLIIKGVAKSLREYPRINSIVKENSIQLLELINIGLAVSLEDGLIVPVIRATDKLKLEEITQKRNDLVEKARRKKLSPDEIKEASIIISNLGMYEIINFIAIIPPSLTSIVAIGRIREIPVVKDEKITTSSIMQITGSFDHRIIDGTYAASFLQEVKNYLEKPLRLLDW